jgi:hypothetical protein
MTRFEYGFELVDAICELIAGGATATAAVASLGVNRRTFFGWISENPEAARLYRAARVARGEHYRDKLDELNRKLEEGLIDPASAREIGANLRKMAAWDAPQLFSDHAKVEVTGKDGKDLIQPDKPRDNLELARWMALVMTRANKQLQQQEPATLAENKRLLSFD